MPTIWYGGLIFYSYRAREYETEDGPWDPISGGASALLGTMASLTMGIADFPIEIFKAVKTKHTTAKENFSAAKEQLSKESSSGEATPASASRSQSQISFGGEETTEPKSYLADSSSQQDSSTFTKTSYEGTDRSSIETPTGTDTPLTNVTSSERRAGSLKQALRGTLSHSRSNSRDRSSGSRSGSRERLGLRSNSPSRQPKIFDPSKLTLDNAIGAGKGVQRIVAAGMKSPMDFTLGIARGFHNAPKLYGDDTVRPQEKVTDFQSGLKAAGKVCVHNSETCGPS